MSLHRMVEELYGTIESARAVKRETKGLRSRWRQFWRRIYRLTNKEKLDDLRDLDELLRRMIEELGPLEYRVRKLKAACQDALDHHLMKYYADEYRKWHGTTEGLAIFLLDKQRDEILLRRAKTTQKERD